MNILLVGEESAGIQMLKVLAASEHRIVAVMASPDKQGATVWSTAEKMGLPTWHAKLVKDPAFASQIREAEVDLLLNVHSLFLINGEVVAAPRLGSYNLHPGPLPRYAGLNTVSWALYRGETEYGVTLHKMEPGIDTGTIAYQSLFKIEENETALSLYAKCICEGVELLKKLLDAASRGIDAIPKIEQDFSKREYFNKKAPDECRVRWTRTAREIANLVRACDYFPFPSPWGHPRASLNGREIHLVKVRLTGRECDAPPGTIGQREGASVEIACTDQWILCDKVMVEGRSIAAAAGLQDAARLDDGA
jgi:methionyl-tRNA formyltransferase